MAASNKVKLAFVNMLEMGEFTEAGEIANKHPELLPQYKEAVAKFNAAGRQLIESTAEDVAHDHAGEGLPCISNFIADVAQYEEDNELLPTMSHRLRSSLLASISWQAANAAKFAHYAANKAIGNALAAASDPDDELINDITDVSDLTQPSEIQKEVSEDAGMDYALPFVDGVSLMPVYRGLRVECARTVKQLNAGKQAPDFLWPAPDTIEQVAYNVIKGLADAPQAQTPKVDDGLAKMLADRKQAKERNKVLYAVATPSSTEKTVAAIIDAYTANQPQELDDAVWGTLPVWYQYKLYSSVFRKLLDTLIAAQNAAESNSPRALQAKADFEWLLGVVQEMRTHMHAVHNHWQVAQAAKAERIELVL